MALLKHVAEYHSQEPLEGIETKEMGGDSSQKEHEDGKDHSEKDIMVVSDKFISWKVMEWQEGKDLWWFASYSSSWC